ncbi:hypothetical protein EVAR_7065_1 [Eumeta japonica]|uniref:Uncharacterized protein n=1 Tax=Eumeta variegata TaxID=151549 RepID=A0A4C1XAV5_EUMVA|nr:hypothetical protein EVAR_7065_1 [Eumeta japonica]
MVGDWIGGRGRGEVAHRSPHSLDEKNSGSFYFTTQYLYESRVRAGKQTIRTGADGDLRGRREVNIPRERKRPSRGIKVATALTCGSGVYRCVVEARLRSIDGREDISLLLSLLVIRSQNVETSYPPRYSVVRVQVRFNAFNLDRAYPLREIIRRKTTKGFIERKNRLNLAQGRPPSPPRHPTSARPSARPSFGLCPT